VLVAGSTADELDPSVVIDPASGEVHVAYWIADGAPRVVRRVAPADLSSWSVEVPVSQPGEIACRPSMALVEGTLRVAYEVHDYGYGTVPRRIVLAEEAPPGGPVYESLTITQFSGPAWPQIHSQGGVVWVDWIDAEGEACWLRKISSAPWDPEQIESFSGPEERDFHVRGEIRLVATQ
jgi:hypothetical protein